MKTWSQTEIFNDDLFQVVEAMKREPELDMESVLEVFRDNDERVRGFLENGTVTEHDNDPVRSLLSQSPKSQSQDQRDLG